MNVFLAVLVALCMGFATSAQALTMQELEKIDKLQRNGIEQFNKGNYSDAVPLFKEVLIISPGDKTAARYLSLAEQQMIEPFCKQAAEAYWRSDYKNAIDIWQRILKTNPGEPRITKLIELTNKLIQDNTSDAMYQLAERFIKERKYDLAINELEKTLSMKPDDARAKEMLATSRQALIDVKVQEHYEKAELLIKQEKFDQAIAEWRQVLELDGKQDAAAKYISSAVRTKLESMYGNARKYVEEGKYSASRDVYYSIIAENPNDAFVEKMIDRLNKTLNVVQNIDDKGVLYDMLRKALANHILVDGNPKAAIVAVRYAEQLDSENRLVSSIRDFLEREHLDVVRSMEPPVKDMNIINQYLFAALNNIYEGRYDLAIQNCSLIIAVQPENTLAWKRLGSGYYAMGEKKKAQDAWARALKLAPEDAELKQFMKEFK